MRTENKTEPNNDCLYVRDSDFLTEQTFREVLAFERKRSERTRNSILLMLLDVGELGNTRARYEIIRKAAKVLATLVRENPVKGWYKQDTVLGAVFIENDEMLKERLFEVAGKEIFLPAEKDALPPVKLVFRSFPEPASGNGGSEGCSVFYPEMMKKEKKQHASFVVKRAMDIFGGVAGIFLFLPFFIALPLLIKASSKGPVLFKQERVGRYGEKFVFLKFRTMYADSDPQIHQDYVKKLILEQKSYDGDGSSGIYKIKDDPRVTPIGRFLRKTSFDELPQFFNVVRGEMSLVGPRPPIPYELDNYDLWHRRRVMEVKPGITGLWQVQGRSSTTFDEMVRLDLKYSKEWSLWLDIKILLKTPWAVLAGKGAY